MRKTKAEKTETKKGLKILKIVANVLIWVFVAFSVLVTVLVFAANNNVVEGIRVPTLGGKTVINILTDSMQPTINSGDIIIGQRVIDKEAKTIKNDSVITFVFRKDGQNTLNTHRIIEVHDEDGDGLAEYYVTKGDNKEANVGDVTEKVVPEKVVSVWTGTRFGKVGSFLNFLQTSTGFLVVIVIPLVLFFVYELIRFFSALRSVKKSGKKEITAADEEEIKRRAVEEYLRQQEAEQKAKEEADKAEQTAKEEAQSAERKLKEAAEKEEEAARLAERRALEEAEALKNEAAQNAEEAAEQAAQNAEEAAKKAAEQIEKIGGDHDADA